MRVKAENPAELLDDNQAPALLRAFFELCHLKNLFRQGWLVRGIPPQRCESVAEHSFGVAVLALWLAQAYYPELDQARVVRMSLLHDFGEVYAGDIIPSDRVSDAEKQRLERDSVERVFNGLPGGRDFISLWEEFEAGHTPEARFVRQVDRLEMGLQARVYQAQGFDQMQEFFDSALKALEDLPLVELLDAAN